MGTTTSSGWCPPAVEHMSCKSGLILLCCAGVYGDWGGDWVDERWVKHQHASAVRRSHTASALCSLCVVFAAQQLPLLALVSLAQLPQVSCSSRNCVHLLAPCTQVRPATDTCSILWPASMIHACPGPSPPSALHAYMIWDVPCVRPFVALSAGHLPPGACYGWRRSKPGCSWRSSSAYH